MELNSRCIQLLREVTKKNGTIPLSEVVTLLDMTRRALYYDLPKINEWLDYNKLGTIEIIMGQIVLSTENSREIEKLLNSFSSYPFSVEERRALEILYITLASEPVTGDLLQEILDVSKNTILSDIKKCKLIFESFNLKIEHNTKKGYCATGDEVAVRKLIGQHLYILENEYPKSIC